MSAPRSLALATLATGLTLAPLARAEPVVFSPTGTQADLQTAVDLVDSPGVVVIPPGKWELLGSVAVNKDGVTLIGAGAQHTLLRRNPPPAGANATERALYTAPFIRTKATTGFRTSSLAITSWLATGGTEDLDVGISLTDATDYRVDHCAFRFTGNSAVTVHGESKGVVDHNTFRDIYEPTIGNYGYGVSVYGTKVHTGDPFGTERATFIEDNTLDGCRHAVASNRGARYVFRHNEVRTNTVSHAVDTHGAEYPPSPKPACDPCYEPDPDNPGTEWAVVHDNLIETPIYPSVAIGLRGGKGLVYRNTIRDHVTAIRLSKQTPQPTGPIYVWDNDLSASTTLVTGTGTCCGSGPVWELNAPSGYTPYAYPHPLVVDVVADAGPDQRVMLTEGAWGAKVFVDGSGSSTFKGSIEDVRWFLSPTAESTCMRDVIDVPVGTHALLVAIKADTGQVEYDTAVLEVVPHGPWRSSPAWADLWFAPFPSQGTISFRIKPGDAVSDAYVGLTGRHDVTRHEDHGIQVRTNNQGRFDARNGNAYAADAQIPYEAGKTYHVQVQFDVAAKRYSVTVDGTGLAKDFAFRSSESLIGQLTAWHADGLEGFEVTDITMKGEQLGPDLPCRDPVDAGPDGQVPPVDAGQDVSTDGSLAEDGPTSEVDGAAGYAGGAATGDPDGCGCGIVGRGRPGIAGLLGLVGLAAFLWAGRRPWRERSLGASASRRGPCSRALHGAVEGTSTSTK
jgi:hypothetical protein